MADINVIQNPSIQKKVMDNILKSSYIFMLLIAGNNPGRFTSTSSKKPFKYKSNGQGGAFTGLMQFDTTIVDTLVNFEYQLRKEFQPITYDQSELDQNKSDATASVELQVMRIEEAISELGDRVGSRLYGIGGTDPVTGAPMVEGLRALIDDGSEVVNYAGVSRTAYAAARSPFLDVNATLNSTTKPNIDTYFSRATVGTQSPDLFLTTKDLYSLYEALITQTQFSNPTMVQLGNGTRTGNGNTISGFGANNGFESIWIKGRPLVGDPLCPDYYFFGINRKRMKWLGLPSTEEGAKPISLGKSSQIEGPYAGMETTNIGLSIREMMKSPNQYGKTTQLILQGALTTDSPRSHFKLLFN